LTSGIGLGSIGGMFTDTYAKPEDAAEFERRVKHHLAQFRKGVVGHLARGVARSDDN
jgi:hypothetical protein